MRRSPRQTKLYKIVFRSLLNCTSEMSLSRNVTGREFQRHGPATEKLLRRIVSVRPSVRLSQVGSQNS